MTDTAPKRGLIDSQGLDAQAQQQQAPPVELEHPGTWNQPINNQPPVLPDWDQLRADTEAIARRLNEAMDRFVEQVRSVPAAMTPPPAAPVSPVDAIPVGRENAKPLLVHWENRGLKASVMGRLFREGASVYHAHEAAEDSEGVPSAGHAVSANLVTSVVPLRVLPDDHVPVPRELVLDLTESNQHGYVHTMATHRLAALLDGEVSA